MTQQDKELLLKDLCARLPYGVKLQQVSQSDTVFDLYSIDANSLNLMFWKYKGKSLEIGDIGKLIRYGELKYKPYLRPMSSMTNKEKEDYHKLCDSYYDIYFDTVNSTDWLNEHHFDYRRLIEKGLAIKAEDGIYKTR